MVQSLQQPWILARTLILWRRKTGIQHPEKYGIIDWNWIWNGQKSSLNLCIKKLWTFTNMEFLRVHTLIRYADQGLRNITQRAIKLVQLNTRQMSLFSNTRSLFAVLLIILCNLLFWCHVLENHIIYICNPVLIRVFCNSNVGAESSR